MNKIVVFGSRHCPDCVNMKEFLSTNNINFVFVDISENMLNLKTFLKYRDSRPEFEEIRKKGRVGIPFIVINNGEKFIFDEKPDLDELRG
jgi:glutaredoxin-related protein